MPLCFFKLKFCPGIWCADFLTLPSFPVCGFTRRGLRHEAAQVNYEAISSRFGDTFLLSSGDEADLNNFVETNHRNSPNIVDVLDVATA